MEDRLKKQGGEGDWKGFAVTCVVAVFLMVAAVDWAKLYKLCFLGS